MVTNKVSLVPFFITRISCGGSIPVFDGLEYVEVSSLHLKGISQPLLIEVSGTSMEPFFYHNDLVLVDLNAKPKNRDIVLIYLNGSYYLKRFECCDGKVTLASTNYAFPKIVLTDTDDWFILGVYVRKL